MPGMPTNATAPLPNMLRESMGGQAQQIWARWEYVITRIYAMMGDTPIAGRLARAKEVMSTSCWGTKAARKGKQLLRGTRGLQHAFPGRMQKRLSVPMMRERGGSCSE
jgi:hypothetical protein